jgi:hypothetical protein
MSTVEFMGAIFYGIGAIVCVGGGGALVGIGAIKLLDRACQAANVSTAIGVYWFERKKRREWEAQAQRIDDLCALVMHCWVHEGRRQCGYAMMSDKQRKLFDGVTGYGAHAVDEDAP